jgi:tetratricopeptide (TPR) repeat protein
MIMSCLQKVRHRTLVHFLDSSRVSSSKRSPLRSLARSPPKLINVLSQLRHSFDTNCSNRQSYSCNNSRVALITCERKTMNSTMQAMMKVAENAFCTGKFGKAEFFLKRAEREGRASKEDDEAVAIAIENLANVQTSLKKFSTAIASYQRAIKYRRQACLLDQRSRVRLYYKVAEAYLYDRNYFRCEQYLKQAWTLDAQRTSNLKQLWRLIVTLNLQNKFDEEQYYRRLYVTLKQQQGMIAEALYPDVGCEEVSPVVAHLVAEKV